MAKKTLDKSKIGAWHGVSLTDKTAEDLKAARAIIKATMDKVEAMVAASHEVPAGHVVRVSSKFGKISWAIVPSNGKGKGEESDIAV